ncbi:hypothetical protein [Candidatus Methylacidithermus pantelleriae]|uniref:hypothetical protein n=1 Tax=Candidatus Methylacidithermus pantelleriae TaxID=2744239 RepID=UPI00157CBED8|nr:hypothetical protein [Candidatus Methylacidithermus pantelleriae]
MVPAAERNRLLLVRLISWIYWLLIFEGAIRKWVLPSQQKALFFLKDPLVLLVYFLAARMGFWSRPPPVLLLAVPLALVGAGIGILQIVFLDQSPLLVAYGWRNYFLYLPLAFVCQWVLRKQELEEIARRTLYLSVPMGLLCQLQVHAPASSPLNVGMGEDESAFVAFGVYGNIVRASGTFSAPLGQSLFVGSCVAFLLYFWMQPRCHRSMSLRSLWIVTVGVVTNLLVSGSRSAYLGALITLGFAVLGTGSPHHVRRVINVVVLLVLAGGVSWVLVTNVFPEVVDAMVTRWTGAAEAEGGFFMVRRIAYDMSQFWRVLDETPFLGFGLGSAGNAALRLGMGQIPYDAEAGWTRNVAELGPVIGLLYIAYRCGLLAFIGWRAQKAARQLRNPLPMILVGFLAPNLFYGLITGQGSVHGYVWLFAGFCLAASQVAHGQLQRRRSSLGLQPTLGRPEFHQLRVDAAGYTS